MKINCSLIEKILTRFIQEELKKFGFYKAVLGLSGGLDSTVCTFLAQKALGKENVLALIMPYKNLKREDVKDAQNIAQTLGIRYKVIDISPMIDTYFKNYPTENKILKGNKMARERMAILYDHSAREKALVLGTSNKTELLLGYGTIYGDLACAINPLGDLYKTQIIQLAHHLGVPEKIINKTPSAGLWPGQTDEGELGLSYSEMDEILYQLIDQRKSKARVISSGYRREKVERIISLVKNYQFKRKLPAIAKISKRTVTLDFLYSRDWGH
ncbi:MAG: NAD+ synthase [Candidatus Aminicenantia bacterium]